MRKTVFVTCPTEVHPSNLNAPTPYVKQGRGKQRRDFTFQVYEQRQRREAPYSLCQTCTDKREGPPHCLSNYSNNFTCRSIPSGPKHYEPTCQIPEHRATVAPDLHQGTNSQLVGRRGRVFQLVLTLNPSRKTPIKVKG